MSAPPLPARAPIPPIPVAIKAATGEPPKPAPSTSRGAVAEALVASFLDEKRKEADLEARRSRRKRSYWGLSIGVAACATAWFVPVGRPGGVPPQVPERYSIASGRLSLLLASRRIDAFRAQYHRLPRTATDAGISDTLVTFSLGAGGSYVLSLKVGETLLTFDPAIAPTVYSEDARAVRSQTEH